MKKTLTPLLVAFFTIVCNICFAQVAVNTTGSQPDASSQLDVSSSSKGILIPRMKTSERNAISAPALGLMVFDTDKGTFMFYDGSKWKALAFADEDKTVAQTRNGDDPATNAAFGSRVAISGNYAVIGSPRYSADGLTNAGAAYVFFKGPSGWKQQAKLQAWDAAASDYFGGGVAISGDYIAVASANKNVGGNAAQGKVYLYKRNGDNWDSDSSITKAGGVAFEDFGWSVSLSATASAGPALMVGVPYSDVAGADKGEVQAFARGASGWAFSQSIVPADLGVSDYFGASVSMYGDYAAIGATGQDNATYSYADAGAVYIFVFGGGVWNAQQKLNGTTAKGQFGFSISLYDNKLAVGAPWATTYSNTSSAVYIYKRTGATWANTTYLFVYNFEIVPAAGQIAVSGGGSSISIANLTFGISVALDGSTLMIGASGGTDYPNGGSSYYSDAIGSVYFYKNFSGETYTRTQIIKSDYPATGDLFGMSLALSDGKYVIANAHAIVNNTPNAGTVYFGAVSQ